MAAVLEFRTTARRSDRAPDGLPAADESRPCEVVIFPGVRRERHQFGIASGESEDGRSR
jgi:hypothetical protein